MTRVAPIKRIADGEVVRHILVKSGCSTLRCNGYSPWTVCTTSHDKSGCATLRVCTVIAWQVRLCNTEKQWMQSGSHGSAMQVRRSWNLGQFVQHSVPRRVVLIEGRDFPVVLKLSPMHIMEVTGELGVPDRP